MFLLGEDYLLESVLAVPMGDAGVARAKGGTLMTPVLKGEIYMLKQHLEALRRQPEPDQEKIAKWGAKLKEKESQLPGTTH